MPSDNGSDLNGRNKSWYRAWQVFCETTSFHGLRNIAQSNNTPRRLVAATENGMYLWLDDMYSRANLSTFNYTEKGVGNVSMLDVYLKNKHLKKDMIVRWKGKNCTHEDFTLTLTDAGVCYTFNAEINADSFVESTGIRNALQLVVNIEQYEHMKGPHEAVGLKVLLHKQRTIPLMQDFADAVPAGMNTFIAVDISREINLPSPHGDCVSEQKLRYFDHYTQAACFRECVTLVAVKTCGCIDTYMPQLRPGSVAKNLSARCVCPKECNVTRYKVSTSYASALNITLFDLYKNANNSEKVRMKEYFKIDFRGGHEAMLQVRENLTSACENRSMSKPEANMQIIDATKHYKAYMWIKRKNFVELNIYMRDLRIEVREQQKAYRHIDLLSDIGGTLGLLIGASVITLCEAIDVFATNLTSRRRNQVISLRRSPDTQSNDDIDRSHEITNVGT
ncbi:hypothetical protein NP493_434g00014 [Ridgeia piscesae]|uniref:Amiloride-sensitive sodium channel n=1 Tax=Ridgeia piscesae TaxID=27915 RepID=A0AAD9KZM8_RIDPI|nr:hypothetical protein NP493_434g00014 [Ridgeia piscesae]